MIAAQWRGHAAFECGVPSASHATPIYCRLSLCSVDFGRVGLDGRADGCGAGDRPGPERSAQKSHAAFAMRRAGRANQRAPRWQSPGDGLRGSRTALGWWPPKPSLHVDHCSTDKVAPMKSIAASPHPRRASRRLASYERSAFASPCPSPGTRLRSRGSRHDRAERERPIGIGGHGGRSTLALGAAR